MKRIILLAFALCALDFTLSAADFSASLGEVRWVGRYRSTADGGVEFDWSGTYAQICFEGSRFEMTASDSGKNYFNVRVDGRESIVATSGEVRTIVLFEGEYGVHNLCLQRRTEGFNGVTRVIGFATDGKLLPATESPKRHIEFIGDSLTCGYGADSESKDEPYTPETQNCNNAYACIIAHYFDSDYNLVAHSGIGVVRNYGDSNSVSEWTMRQKMRYLFDDDSQRCEWSYEQSPYHPDLVVIFLGTNDLSTKPFPSLDDFVGGYADIVAQLRQAYGDQTPILCVAPYVYDPGYDYVYRAVHSGAANLHFACILPEYCNSTNELGASEHPNKTGQQKMAMLLIPYISTITGWPVKAL